MHCLKLKNNQKQVDTALTFCYNIYIRQTSMALQTPVLQLKTVSLQELHCVLEETLQDLNRIKMLTMHFVQHQIQQNLKMTQCQNFLIQQNLLNVKKCVKDGKVIGNAKKIKKHMDQTPVCSPLNDTKLTCPLRQPLVRLLQTLLIHMYSFMLHSQMGQTNIWPKTGQKLLVHRC